MIRDARFLLGNVINQFVCEGTKGFVFRLSPAIAIHFDAWHQEHTVATRPLLSRRE
jgi:hypothetical protein